MSLSSFTLIDGTTIIFLSYANRQLLHSALEKISAYDCVDTRILTEEAAILMSIKGHCEPIPKEPVNDSSSNQNG